jgi:acyl carrier protein
MTKAEILKTVETIVGEVVDTDDVSLTPESTAEDVPGWDSAAHVNILIAVEAKFGIRFDASEISEISSVGMLLDMIESKAATRAA